MVMPIPVPSWLQSVIVVVATATMGIGFFVLLGILLPWAWASFFNYMGRNELRETEESDEKPGRRPNGF